MPCAHEIHILIPVEVGVEPEDAHTSFAQSFLDGFWGLLESIDREPGLQHDRPSMIYLPDEHLNYDVRRIL